ncbi:flagellar biosynthetic protein FliO [Pectobacterium fontis]|uniref:Flagellar protein n=1 Tax=Pectobacterium fontis TaxID=2558042 RepID=A0A7V8IK68_9GAMM|nr:flagellar biosynthetic protein FliO [Pectobacterium fontis]KHN53595.1 flagellar assembly protein FliO [Pectobacterium fontis]
MATASVSSPTSVSGQQSTLVTEPPLTGSMLLTQVGSVLAGILLFILLIAWLARKLGFAPQGKQNKLLKVVSSCPVGQRERVVIVEVDNTWLVLGVTTQQITPLHTLPAQPTTDSSSTGDIKPVDFNQLLKKVLKRPEKSE